MASERRTSPPRRRRSSPRSLLLLGLTALLGCKEPAEPAASAPPNVLLIVVDTLRADHLSLYGYPRPTSPTLDRLGREGLVFDRAFTVMSQTLPAHVSLMTGLHTATHGVLNNHWTYTGRYPTLAERLHQKGYRSAGFVSGFPVRKDSGLARGFDVYEDTTVEGASGPMNRIPGEVTTERALRWLERQRASARPFFLFVHYYDPHFPYHDAGAGRRPFEVDPALGRWMARVGIPPGLRVQDVSPGPIEVNGRAAPLPELINAYDNQVHRVDGWIGQLLSATEALGEALVVVTSDHGEGLGQHGYYAHGLYLYEEQLRVPLIVRAPTSAGWGRGRFDGAVSLLDVAPTVLDLLGLGPDATLHGQPLPHAPDAARSPRWLLGQRRLFLPSKQAVAGRFTASTSLHALRGDDPLKYLRTGDGGEELYDLSVDPFEQVNLAARRPEDAARLRERLSALVVARKSGAPSASAGVTTSADVEALRSLGYFQ